MSGKIAFISQLVVAIIALIRYKRFKSKFMFILCFFLIVIVLVEGYGLYQITFGSGKETISIISFYILIEFFSIVLMYKSIINRKKHLMAINITAVFFFIIYLSSFFIKNIRPFDLIPLESLLIAVIVVVYLIELLQSDKIIDYKRNLSFWISVGFFVFYLSSIPFFSMYKYMVERNLFYIVFWLIILMNVFIGFGLLWSKTEEKY